MGRIGDRVIRAAHPLPVRTHCTAGDPVGLVGEAHQGGDVTHHGRNRPLGADGAYAPSLTAGFFDHRGPEGGVLPGVVIPIGQQDPVIG